MERYGTVTTGLCLTLSPVLMTWYWRRSAAVTLHQSNFLCGIVRSSLEYRVSATTCQREILPTTFFSIGERGINESHAYQHENESPRIEYLPPRFRAKGRNCFGQVPVGSKPALGGFVTSAAPKPKKCIEMHLVDKKPEETQQRLQCKHCPENECNT